MTQWLIIVDYQNGSHMKFIEKGYTEAEALQKLILSLRYTSRGIQTITIQEVDK